MTGAVASERVTEALSSPSAAGNRAKSVKAEGSLTASQTRRAGTKVAGLVIGGTEWKGHRSTEATGITG